jgi:hypothetical protein
MPCLQTYFDDDKLPGKDIGTEEKFWMVNDSEIECFATDGYYWYFATLSMFMVIVFVIGWPLTVFMFLRHYTNLVAVRLASTSTDDDRAKVAGFNPPPRSGSQPIPSDIHDDRCASRPVRHAIRRWTFIRLPLLGV